VAAARLAVRQHDATVIVLDDGFQHRRLGRDLDVVLIDATCPFGYGHLLPRGLLREPLESLARADAVILTRVDQVTESQRKSIGRRISHLVPPSRVASASFEPGGWLGGDGEMRQLDPSARVLAFCGIGNPEAFRRSLPRHCHNVVDFCSFADHHPYSPGDWQDLQRRARQRQADCLVCTVKDLVKIRNLPPGQLPVVAACIEPRFQSGEAMLRDLVKAVISRPDVKT
jgi:tetraacyldisaccharide 4'-kinase